MRTKERASDMEKETRLSIKFIITALVAITNLSNMPLLMQYSNSYVHLLWFLALVTIIFLKRKIEINDSIYKISCSCIFFLILIIILELFTSNKYLEAPHTKLLLSSLFLIICGSNFSKEFIFNTQQYYAYYFSAVIVAFNVYVKYLLSFDFDNLIYAYASKNSVSQIILTAIFIGFIIPVNNKKIRFFIYSLNILLIYELLMLRSRASILGLIVFALTVIFANNGVNKKMKIVIVAFCTILLYLIIFDDSVYNFIINNLLLNNRAGGTLDDISSNRAGMIIDGVDIFLNNTFYGVGNYFIECFYLSTFVQYGIFGGLYLTAYTFLPLLWFIKNKNKLRKEVLFFILVTLSYILNGVFESQAPLGPGVKCYYLWVLFGAGLSDEISIDNKETR